MIRMLKYLTCLSLATTVSLSESALIADESQPPGRADSTVIRDYKPRQVIPNPIRPIVDPEIVSADKSEVADNELVIGVEVNGKARAYSINQLTGPRREIINDQLGGTAIAATW